MSDFSAIFLGLWRSENHTGLALALVMIFPQDVLHVLIMYHLSTHIPYCCISPSYALNTSCCAATWKHGAFAAVTLVTTLCLLGDSCHHIATGMAILVTTLCLLGDSCHHIATGMAILVTTLCLLGDSCHHIATGVAILVTTRRSPA